ncbi:MAG: class I SAM-dependent methyltransferase [Pseudomonadota bacterium]
MFKGDKPTGDQASLKAIEEGFAKIEARLDRLEQRLDTIANGNINWGMIYATQQLENRQNLSYRLGVDEGWLPPTRGWAASPDFLMLIARLVAELDPTQVVECGSGVTSVVLSKLLSTKPGARLLSFDHDAAFAQKTAALLQERDLPGALAMTIASAPLVPHQIQGQSFNWYATDGVDIPDQIELLVVDGPIVTGDNLLARYPALPLLADRLTDRAVVVLDDANRVGEQQTLQRWTQEFPGWQVEMVATEKGTAILRRG